MPLEMIKDGHLGGYFRGGDLGTWCPFLWRWLVKTFDVRSVLDVGCGEGHSTKFFRDLGCDVLGVDGCQQAIRDSVVPKHVVLHDFRDGPFVTDGKFDLIWSCEFVEHVEERFLPHVLETFSLAEKAIAVTHAFPGQKGYHHVNCQNSGYWIRHIESLGFACPLDVTMQARHATLEDHPRLNHFARGGLVFNRHASAAEARPIARGSTWKAWLKGSRINLGFSLSKACRKQRRTYRATKRQANRRAA